MNVRIPTTPIVRGLFSNVPIEAAMTDAEIVRKFGPAIPHKTFSRIRIKPPHAITSPQLLLLARMLATTTEIDASRLFHHLRHPVMQVCPRLKMLASSQVFGHSPKSHEAVKTMCDDLARTAQTIQLFDRGSSFSYLLPPADDETSVQEMSQQPTPSVSNQPQIAITITLSSLAMRQRKIGDEAFECLIDRVEQGAHLAILNDSRRNFARIRRGIFEDARALAIIDSRAMFVLPDHGRAVRCYRAEQSAVHSDIIQSGIDQLERIGQFRMQLPDRAAMIAFLKSHLSYRLPYSSEKSVPNGSRSASRPI